MLERLLVAGSGGQGIVLAGKLLATVAVNEIPHVTFFPAYGAEVRGGTSNCEVILSSSEIASPVSLQLDSMILMNQASSARFLSHAAEGCLLLVNTSLCSIPPGSSAAGIAATEMADRLGDTRVANFIMLGTYVARKPFVPAREMEEGTRRLLAGKGKKLVEMNIAAFRLGLES